MSVRWGCSISNVFNVTVQEVKYLGLLLNFSMKTSIDVSHQTLAL